MIDQNTMERYAGLAKIRLDPHKDLPQLNAMLELFGQIDGLALTVAGEPYDLERVNALREDTAIPSMPREQLLANAPAVEAGCVSVPKIL